MNDISPEGSVRLQGGPNSVPLLVVSNVSGFPMVTLTKYAERIYRYDDGTVEVYGPSGMDGIKPEKYVSTPEGAIAYVTWYGRKTWRPSSKLILEASARQGLTIHDGGTR